MQRTAVVFGLAASTLIGALLLVPRSVEAPRPPVPMPAPHSEASITQLVYGDGTVEVQATLDRGLLMPGGEPVWMDVAIKASGVQTRAPLAAVLVIDRSGSMAGDKIDAARQAAERFVNGMADGDMLAVVTYGSDVSVDFPFTTVDPQSRTRALGVVRRIEEGGGTNIDGGLLAAQNQLQHSNTSGKVARVILISDGRPTEGDRRATTLAGHSQSLRTGGVTMSTIGLGLDYNEDLMEQLAVVGGGRYHYLKTGAQMAKILDDELQHGRNVVASNVKLHLDRALAPGVRVLEAIGQTDSGNGRKLVITSATSPPAKSATCSSRCRLTWATSALPLPNSSTKRPAPAPSPSSPTAPTPSACCPLATSWPSTPAATNTCGSACSSSRPAWR